MASALESIPPSDTSARTTAITTGRSAMNMNGASVSLLPAPGSNTSGQQNIMSPANGGESQDRGRAPARARMRRPDHDSA
ncbi:MAG: hypothetical protein WKF83_15450 [Nocardioidaceae bacterium]